MAALLNPTALTAPSGSIDPRSGQRTERHPGASSVAPWNRSEPRRPAAPRHLQLVTQAPAARRNPLRVLLAGLGLAVLVAFAAMGIVPFLGADAAASTPASTTDIPGPTLPADPAPSPVVAPAGDERAAIEEIVVQSGDSLWTIARRLQPRGDLRHLVDRLIERVGATTVTRGQHIDVRGLLD